MGQAAIDKFMKEAVNELHCNKNVIAYGPSNGENLGDWFLVNKDGSLSTTGKTYLSAIKSFKTSINQCGST